MARVVLDSSVLIALIKPSDRHHQVAAKEFLSGRDKGHSYEISSMSLLEVMTHGYRQGARQAESVRQHLDQVISRINGLDEELALEAAAIRASTGLRAPDASISATAIKRQAQLWTFDKELAKKHPKARLLA